LIDTVSASDNKIPEEVRHLILRVDGQRLKERLPSIINTLMSVYGQSASTIVFTDTKSEANSISSTIDTNCGVLHGDLSQTLRESTLHSFRNGKFPCLVATNVAARGLDIPSIDLIIQTQPPTTSETYIHRAGRTGRAGRHGTVITLYSLSRQYQLNHLAKETGVTFQNIDLPTQLNLLKNAMENVFKEMEEVHPDNIRFFQNVVKEYFVQKQQKEGSDSEQVKTKKTKKEEIIKSFASLLAVSTNNKKPICWTPSLLSSNASLVSLKVTAQAELGEKIESSVDLKKALVDHFSKLSQSKTGKSLLFSIPNAVKVPNEKFTYIIDVPVNFVNPLLDLSESDNVLFEHLLQLPEGVQKISSIPNNSFQRRNFGRQGGNNFNGGGGNSFAGRSNFNQGSGGRGGNRSNFNQGSGGKGRNGFYGRSNGGSGGRVGNSFSRGRSSGSNSMPVLGQKF